jgi:hypothetical protein
MFIFQCLIGKKLVLSVIIVIMLILGSIMTIRNTWLQQSADGKSHWPSNLEKVPIAISGDDICIV